MLPVFVVASLILSGCVQRTKSGKPYGLIYDHLAIPTQHVINWLTSVMGGSYGWAIIAITFIVRMCLMPLMLRQARGATIQQEKMASVRPQMADIQERQKNASSTEEKTAISQEMMALYRENGISMTGGIGCLPLLIQMPIFAALYAAIQYSPELSKTVFMGINLGNPSIILAVLTVIIYGIQAYLSLLGVAPEQKKADAVNAFYHTNHVRRNDICLTCWFGTVFLCWWNLCLFANYFGKCNATKNPCRNRS